MASVIDLWRAVDPGARLVSGSSEALGRPVRGVARSRTAPPHLPPAIDGQLLVVDAHLITDQPLDVLVAALRDAELRPVAIAVGAAAANQPFEPAGDKMPILATPLAPSTLHDAATTYLADEAGSLERLTAELRLGAAEAALANPEPGAAAGLVAARLRRGVAVSADGALRSLHPRPAGRALAARFVALHARLLAGAGPGRVESIRRSREGLWLLERRVRAGASVWLFDDLPFARVDEVGADALTVTLRALLRRPIVQRTEPQASPPASAETSPTAGLARGRMAETLLAVARANGRVAPAARALGVHRNTVLYRLRVAQAELGIDPRRPEDALRILADAHDEDGR